MFSAVDTYFTLYMTVSLYWKLLYTVNPLDTAFDLSPKPIWNLYFKLDFQIAPI